MRFDVDLTAERFDFALNNVHADAAPADVADFFRGGEAGQEDDSDGVRVIHRVDFFLAEETFFHSFAANDIRVDTFAVVGDHDDDVVALVARDKSDFTDTRLALCLALVRHFDSVVERVAQEVHNRVADFVDDRAVEFGVLAFDCQIDFFVEFLGYVANHAREAVKDLADGNHADLHDDVLKIGRHSVHLLQSFRELGKSVRLPDLFEANFIYDQLAHQVHERVEFFNVDADGLPRMTFLLRRRICRLLTAARRFIGGRGRFGRGGRRGSRRG